MMAIFTCALSLHGQLDEYRALWGRLDECRALWYEHEQARKASRLLIFLENVVDVFLVSSAHTVRS